MRTPIALFTVAAVAALTFTPSPSFADSNVSVGHGPRTEGNGQVVTQSRSIGNFTEIEARGASEVEVRVGPAPSLAITADSNIIPLLSSDIRGRKLILDTRGSYHMRRSPRIVVTVPVLNAAALAGSGNMRVEGIGGRSVALAVDGSGNMTASGQAGSLAVAVNGSGNADARHVRAGSVTAAINGSGNATVTTNGSLSGAISGSGNILYEGRPSGIIVSRHGSGDVGPAR